MSDGRRWLVTDHKMAAESTLQKSEFLLYWIVFWGTEMRRETGSEKKVKRKGEKSSDLWRWFVICGSASEQQTKPWRGTERDRHSVKWPFPASASVCLPPGPANALNNAIHVRKRERKRGGQPKRTNQQTNQRRSCPTFFGPPVSFLVEPKNRPRWRGAPWQERERAGQHQRPCSLSLCLLGYSPRITSATTTTGGWRIGRDWHYGAITKQSPPMDI